MPAPVPPDRPVRYGLIGTGMMGVEHLWNIQHLPDAEVTAVADPHAGSRDLARVAAGEGHPPFEVYEDHRDLLASGRCDIVVVATPNHTHLEVMRDVLETDVHVLVEKPLAISVAGCREIIERARRRDGLVWVGLEYRYMPPVARLIAEVRAGAVGRPLMVAIREHRFPFLAKIGDWNRFTRNTGGTLVEKCCHFFDLMAHVLDDRPVRVMASGAQDVNHLDEIYDGEVPDIMDNAFVIVDFAGGARASLDLCMFAEGSENQEEISVVGDTGKLEAFLPSGQLRRGARVAGRGGVTTEVVTDERVAYEGFHHGSSYLEHLDLVAAVRAGSAAGVDLEAGLMSVAVGVAAHRSIDEGRAVTLDEVLGA